MVVYLTGGGGIQKNEICAHNEFRVIHHQLDLGWDDFDRGYSTLFLILLGHMEFWQHGIQVKVNPTQSWQ